MRMVVYLGGDMCGLAHHEKSVTKIGSVGWKLRTAQAWSIDRNKNPQVNMHKKKLKKVEWSQEE